MAADQQFCLRWNNHQSTLISVFDTLLENGTLVDCTLAAEGQFIRAHKVVLSACSPYFELLLSQHYDKHPIVVLKDVKFAELRAMMDYMYRGEVNILQDQLGSLLKVAESLQIKGLSEGGEKEKKAPDKRQESRKQPPAPRTPPPSPLVSTVNNRKAHHSTPIHSAQENSSVAVESPPVTPKPPPRDECMSPIARKRKKHRQQSFDDANSLPDGFENNCELSNELPPQTFPSPSTSQLPVANAIKPLTPVPHKEEPPVRHKSLPSEPRSKPAPPAVPIKTETETIEPPAEVALMEPKAEFIEEEDEDVQDLTLDDDDEDDYSQPGPSHGGEGSSQGFSSWNIGNQDEFMTAQEAGGVQRDSQEIFVKWSSVLTTTDQILPQHPIYHNMSKERINLKQKMQQQSQPMFIQLTFTCDTCSRSYSSRRNLQRHLQECGILAFECDTCSHSYSRKESLQRHVRKCGTDLTFQCDICFRSYSSKKTLQRHSQVCGTDLTFQCDICFRSYSSKKTLQRHLQECGRDPAFHCPVCIYAYRRKWDLMHHIRRHHQDMLYLLEDEYTRSLMLK